MVSVIIYSDQPVLAMGLASLIAGDPQRELSGYGQKLSPRILRCRR
jgi:hypothetical protein